MPNWLKCWGNVQQKDYLYLIVSILFPLLNSWPSWTNSALGAGANTLAKGLTFNPNLPVRNMTVENYNEVSVLFENWPFKPQHIDDEFEFPPNHRRKWWNPS